MWNYVYYSMYLDSIDTSNHTAIQKQVYDLVRYLCVLSLYVPHDIATLHYALYIKIFIMMQIMEGKSDFFPKEEACCLEGGG